MPRKRYYKKRKYNSTYRGYGAYYRKGFRRYKKGTGNPWVLHGYGDYWEDFKTHVHNIWHKVKYYGENAWPYIKAYGPWVAAAILTYLFPGEADKLVQYAANWSNEVGLTNILAKVAKTRTFAENLPQPVVAAVSKALDYAHNDPQVGMHMVEDVREQLPPEEQLFRDQLISEGPDMEVQSAAYYDTPTAVSVPYKSNWEPTLYDAPGKTFRSTDFNTRPVKKLRY